MTPDVSIRQAAQLMVQNNVHRLVVAENQTIKGIVSSMDIIRGYLSR
ncbi:MAG: CBS domain-containing protein [Gammaproteobacteria bacterium]|nr:MAG: CBS domain-containing protein [Gammaproteobacteria bacterium]